MLDTLMMMFLKRLEEEQTGNKDAGSKKYIK